MDHITRYYKNLCEQLQEKINILEVQLNEAGLKRALQTKNPQLLKKEKLKAFARRERYIDAAKKADILGTMRKYGASSQEAGIAGMEHELRHEQARRMIQNIIKIEDEEQNKGYITPSQY